MPLHYRFFLLWLTSLILTTDTQASIDQNAFPANPTGWPGLTQTQKPWTRWWWLGSAVDRPNLTHQLEDFAKVGIGGVEICPIYGASGAENRELQFLSPQWMSMLAHTTREASRLDLGVDMTTGTGWPFGGPKVTQDIASSRLNIIQSDASGGTRLTLTLPTGNVQCLKAYPNSGAPIDLAHYVQNGILDWLPPLGDWKIIGLSSLAPIQKVKRAAPGGEGNVLDPFSPHAMSRYLLDFENAFKNFQAPPPRAQFHDSFEYYDAEWTPDFLEKFSATRGYDLREQLAAFAGIGEPDTISRVRADYRETLGELHLSYLKCWHDWAKSHGEITRNQAHGSPGNLLDDYAISDIPETEIFRNVDETQIPMMRIAASAAHSNGTTLVSSETFTWLGEHFQVTPEKLKAAADFVFLGGVNHIFFHGIPYSPEDAPWPGWLFYASTHLGENGGLWRDLSAFTAYIQRCQSILQAGKPSADVLLYYPIHDLLHNPQEKLPLFTIHNQDKWLWPTPFYHASMELLKSGIPFDYVSDAMLSQVSVSDGKLILGGNAYRALVLAGIHRMPPAALRKIIDLNAQGAAVVIQGGWPTDVPGLHLASQRRTELLEIEAKASGKRNILQAQKSIIPALEQLGIASEPMTEHGLRFIRRIHPDGYHYFIVNRSDTSFESRLLLSVPFESVVIMDPWNPSQNRTITRQSNEETIGIPLKLAPGQSVILRTFTTRKVGGTPWSEPEKNQESIALSGPWKIQFFEGGPILPRSEDDILLGSWTQLHDPSSKDFSGSARYTTTFDLAEYLPTSCTLDLGRVANTARVSVNGRSVSISWCEPHLIDIHPYLRLGKNLLEIEVTNLAANRIADLDRRKIPWKQFHEINFVNIDYKLFDASQWPALDSGLLGPVRLIVPKVPY